MAVDCSCCVKNIVSNFLQLFAISISIILYKETFEGNYFIGFDSSRDNKRNSSYAPIKIFLIVSPPELFAPTPYPVWLALQIGSCDSVERGVGIDK